MVKFVEKELGQTPKNVLCAKKEFTRRMQQYCGGRWNKIGYRLSVCQVC